MPIYEYVCSACGLEFEAMQKFSDPPLTTCECGESGQVARKLSLSAFQLKGGGWYKDRYGAGNGGSSDSTTGSDSNTAATAKSDAGGDNAGGKANGSGDTGKSSSTGTANSGSASSGSGSTTSA